MVASFEMPREQRADAASSVSETELASQAAIGRALRPQRLLLSVVAIVLMAVDSRGGGVVYGGGIVVFITLTALVNIAWNALLLRSTTADPTQIKLVQIIIDLVLAVVAITAIDSQSTPLAWIILLIPVLDAALWGGLGAAATVWTAASLFYLAILLGSNESGTADAEVLHTGLQQIAAVLAVAIPATLLMGWLRRDIEVAHTDRQRADVQKTLMTTVSAAANQMARAATPQEILAQATATACNLGFSRADICIRSVAEPWQVVNSFGLSRAPDPQRDRLLARAFGGGQLSSAGASESAVTDRQELQALGYDAAFCVVAPAGDDRWIGLRAFSTDAIPDTAPVWESLEMLTALVASGWVNRTTQDSLASWARQLEYEATHDTLTGLGNRTRLFTELAGAMETAAPSLTVLFMDLDGFKSINDTLGHSVGDQVLVEVGRRLVKALEGSGTAFRLGGDEFVLLSANRDADAVDLLARNIISCIGEPVELSDGSSTVRVGTSIGSAHWSGQDIDDLLRDADVAMYEAKQKGRELGVSQHRASVRH